MLGWKSGEFSIGTAECQFIVSKMLLTSMRSPIPCAEKARSDAHKCVVKLCFEGPIAVSVDNLKLHNSEYKNGSLHIAKFCRGLPQVP
jgi:hypothetical protein